MMLATVAYACMVSGALLRKFPLAHSRLMLTAIVLDLALVLTLQVQRGAVQVAASFELTGLQYVHIGSSTLATVLYFPVLWSGYRLKTKRTLCSVAFRRRHVRLGWITFAFRTIGFIAMFTIIDRVRHS